MPTSTILVLDECLDSLRRVANLLGEFGYTVFTANDGVNGVRLAFEHRPALVLTDLLIPGMSGFRVLDHLKNDPAYQPVVLLMSEFDAPLHRAYATALGGDGFLSKPLNLDSLIDIVLQLCPLPVAPRPTSPTAVTAVVLVET